MKKRRFLIAALIVVLVFVAAYVTAELLNVTAKGVDGNLVFYDASGNEICTFDAANRKLSFPSGSNIDINSGASITVDSGATLTVSGTFSNSRERGFTLPLNGFTLSSGEPVSSTTAPGIEIDDSIPGIVWSDGETTPVMITFRVPYDYSSGGAFRLICTESDSTTPNQVDFDVYVNRDGRAADSSATDQTPVALAGTTATPDVITLTPATDLTGLAAGDWITVRIWRDDTATGTGDLEVKGVEFFYTATR